MNSKKKKQYGKSLNKLQEFHGTNSLLSVRAAAVIIVRECVESGLSLATLLPRYLEQVQSNQRPLTQEISYGVLRWFYRLNPMLEKMLTKPLKGKKKTVHYLLLTGLYQLNYLNKADYAIVKETVNTCDELQQSWAKGLSNAILRRFLREKDALLAELDQSYASLYAYPEWLINAIKLSWNKSEHRVVSILAAGNQRPPMSLRVNRCCVFAEQQGFAAYKKQLEHHDISFSEPSCADPQSHTLILDKPLPVEKLPFFSIGAVSVQDGAAQMAAALLAPEAGDRILDACAAPGGKTMHLFEQQPLLEKVVALDVSEDRLERVKENSIRLQVPLEKLDLMVADATTTDWWDGQLFERILLDAPCSATGVIRRHPDIKILRREEDIAALTQLQSRIFDNLWLMLKPGGMFLYATCSILRDENDHQVSAFLERHTDDASEVLIQANWGHTIGHGRQILPGEQGMDGFYYALLRKNS